MTEQIDLFDNLLEENCNVWVEANPNTYRRMVEFALSAKRSGRNKFGIAASVERVRWWGTVEMRLDEFKINNNHKAYLARRMMRDKPELKDFFELRITKRLF